MSILMRWFSNRMAPGLTLLPYRNISIIRESGLAGGIADRKKHFGESDPEVLVAFFRQVT